jgi:hypothetical protein
VITAKTVLILGAGASWDYGFPTGQLLKAKIWQILSESEFREMSKSDVDFNNFRRSLELTPDVSIDAFLEHNFKEFGMAGKEAIAAVLLPYEKEKNLFRRWIMKELGNFNPTNFYIPKNGQHWYSNLFNKMSEGVGFEKFKQNPLTVITFNYDRSFEWFMLKALSAKYQKTPEECVDVLKCIPIIHVYGQLGQILNDSKQSDHIKYDSWDVLEPKQKCEVLQRAAKSIKIIHEGESDLVDMEKAQNSFKYADRIYFLGFGYHMSNMEKLFNEIGNISGMGLGRLGNNLLKNTYGNYNIGPKCFGTAYGVSPHQRKQLMDYGLTCMNHSAQPEISGNFTPNFPDATIYDFLVYNPNAEF